MTEEQTYTIFYDGNSERLASEMIWFERRDSGEQLRFVDVRAAAPQLIDSNLDSLLEPNCLFAIDAKGALLSGRALIESLLGCVGLAWLCRPDSEPILRQASPLCFGILNDEEEKVEPASLNSSDYAAGRTRLV